MTHNSFYIYLFQFSTCFEQAFAHHQESLLLLLLSVGLAVANAPDVLQPCGLLHYP